MTIEHLNKLKSLHSEMLRLKETPGDPTRPSYDSIRYEILPREMMPHAGEFIDAMDRVMSEQKELI
jgi:hypothetical protein